MGGKGGGANAFKNNKLTVGEKKNNLLLFAPPHDIWIFRRLCIYLVFYNTMYRPLIIQSYITQRKKNLFRGKAYFYKIFST